MHFEGLRETLLTGGIASRHVRRYLSELSEHLADLTAEQWAAGFEPEDAAICARARLGSDEELAGACLRTRNSVHGLRALRLWYSACCLQL